jgi:hypothetical protein
MYSGDMFPWSESPKMSPVSTQLLVILSRITIVHDVLFNM